MARYNSLLFQKAFRNARKTNQDYLVKKVDDPFRYIDTQEKDLATKYELFADPEKKMLNYPFDYLSAKEVINYVSEDEYYKHIIKRCLIKALIGLSIDAAFWLFLNLVIIKPFDLALCFFTAFSLFFVTMPLYIPLFVTLSTMRKIKTGKYFSDRSEGTVLSIAQDYCDAHNKYIREKQEIQKTKNEP